VRRFCERQGFRPSTTDHDFYDMVLPDGSTAGAKISFSRAETDPVSSALWPRIWKRQLRLRAEDEVWRGIDGAPVAYDIPRTADPAATIPDFLARHLRDDRHLSEGEIAAMSREDAQRLPNTWYSRDRGG
jgi:hypothetical protein